MEKYIYESVISGVVNNNVFTVNSVVKENDLTGFRPKGLYTGTLVATSFIIYLTVLFRNRLRFLFFLFVMSLLVNGRLALLISSLTLFLNLLISRDIKLDNKRLSLFLKFLMLWVLFVLLIIVILFYLPDNVRLNYLSIFNFESDSNFGRLISYFQSIDLLLSYSVNEKFFGTADSIVFDQYGRETASESGFLSMLLDVGIVGLFIYLLTFFLIWRMDKMPLLNTHQKIIGFKYVIIVTFVSFLQYEHINGNVRGSLFWFIMISYYYSLREKHLL